MKFMRSKKLKNVYVDEMKGLYGDLLKAKKQDKKGRKDFSFNLKKKKI
jgi:hypothetical protein